MNNENKAKLRKIMEKMRLGRVTGTPQSAAASLAGFGMFASGLDKISKMMQQYSIDNRIEGMSDPDAFNKAMLGAQLGMRMLTVPGARLMQRFVQDHYQYTVHPAIRSLGRAGGKYGYILENYIQAKSDIKKSWGDIGAQVGGGLAIGLGFLTKGLRLTSLSAAATGIGIPAAAVGIIASIAVEAVASMILPWIGRKVGEMVAEKGGFTEKYSKPTLANDILGTIPEGVEHFKSVASSVVGQIWYKPEDSYVSYFSTMQKISRRNTGGISMNDLGMSVRETGTLYDAVGKFLNVDSQYRGHYTSTLGTLKGITGQDFMETFSGISQGSALSKTMVSSKEIDATADAFRVFFDAVSKGSRETNKSALYLTKSLAAVADSYAKRNISVENVDVMFAGVQKFVQANMQADGKQDTSEAGDIVGIMDKVAKSSHQSPLATQISNYAGLELAEAKRGLNAEGLQQMSKAFSNIYNFGGDSSIKNGVMKLGRKGENAFAQMYLDATLTKEEGGLGLSQNEALQLIKYVLAYQTNPNELKFGGPVKNPLEAAAREIKDDAIIKVGKSQIEITDHYEKLTGHFSKDFTTLSDTILRFGAQTTEKIAKGALNLLTVAKGLTEGTTDWQTTPGDVTTTDGVVLPGASTTVAGRSVVSTKDMMIAPSGFKEEIMGAASKAGVDLKTLYAFFGAESVFGTNVRNYKGMDYVGVGQVGQEAQDHMNNVHNTNLNRFKRSDNILLAAYYVYYLRDRYVRMKKKEFKGYNFDPNDPRVIYIAYNWGMGNLDAHIRRYGGINWDALPAETKIGVRNVERAMAGFDASQITPVQQPSGVSNTRPQPSGVSNTKHTVLVSNYNGGVIRGVNNNSHRSKEALLYKMSGSGSAVGNEIASQMERLLASKGRYAFKAGYDFYGMCATIAGWGLTSSGYANRVYGNADKQRDEWMRRGMTMTLDEVMATGGFQPGDLVYFREGNHVGVVTFDGSIIQAGYASDETGSELVRTDATTFGRTGTNAIVVRVSADKNRDGRLSEEERRALLTTVAMYTKTKTTVKNVQKTLKGKEVMVNALVKGYNGTFTVKNSRGAGLSKSQVARIKKQEAAIEKYLGLEANQLTIGTRDAKGGTFLDVKINVPMGDVGKVAQDLIKIIERML